MKKVKLKIAKEGVKLPENLDLKITDLEASVSVIDRIIAICIGKYNIFSTLNESIINNDKGRTFARKRQATITNNEIYISIPKSIIEKLPSELEFNITEIEENNNQKIAQLNQKEQKEQKEHKEQKENAL